MSTRQALATARMTERSNQPKADQPIEANSDRVERCICFDVAFDDILSMFESGQDLGQIHTKTGFGARCSLCVPYVIRCLQIKNPTLPVLWSEDFRRFGISPGAIQAIEQQLSASKTAG